MHEWMTCMHSASSPQSPTNTQPVSDVDSDGVPDALTLLRLAPVSCSLPRLAFPFTGKNSEAGSDGNSAPVGVFSADTVSTAATTCRRSRRSTTRGRTLCGDAVE